MLMGRLLFFSALAVGLLWVFRFVFLYGRRRQAPVALLVVAGADVFCGLGNALLGGAHLFGVIARALASRNSLGASAFTYDFRFYSLVLLGLLIAVPGFLCLVHARGLTRGDASARQDALWLTVWLLALNGPLIPLQGFAVLLSGLALLNLTALAVSRRRFS